MRVMFYTRPNCSLCEDARMMLQLVQTDISFDIEEVNIETDDALLEKYMIRIPVVEYEGKVVQEGIVDYPTLLENLTEMK